MTSMPYSAATAASRPKSGGPAGGGRDVAGPVDEGARRGLDDLATDPARDHTVMEPYHAHWRHAVDVLAAPFRRRGRRRAELRAGIALALSFDTWRTLCRDQGLTIDRAAELMLRVTAPSDRS
jgi:hypothetical protein